VIARDRVIAVIGKARHKPRIYADERGSGKNLRHRASSDLRCLLK
jgi:hypothetical protein